MSFQVFQVSVEESTIKHPVKSNVERRPLFRFLFQNEEKSLVVYSCVFYNCILYTVKVDDNDVLAYCSWRNKLTASIRDFNRENEENKDYLEPGENIKKIPKLTSREFDFIYNFVVGYVIEKMPNESIKIEKEPKNPLRSIYN